MKPKTTLRYWLPPPLPVVRAPGSGRSDESSLTGRTNSSSNRTPNSTTTAIEDISEIQRELQPSFALVNDSNESTNSSQNSDKKRRRSSQAVQHNYAAVAKQRKIQSQGMKLATVRIKQNSLLSPTNPKKRSHTAIVEEVNEAVGSNVNVKTAGRMVLNGMVGVSPLKKGPTGSFPSNIWKALKNAFVSFET